MHDEALFCNHCGQKTDSSQGRSPEHYDFSEMSDYVGRQAKRAASDVQAGAKRMTDRRFYFKGKCYKKMGHRYMAVDEEWTVDLPDITATGFRYIRRIFILLLAIGTTWPTIRYVAELTTKWNAGMADYGQEILWVVQAAVFWIIYFLSKHVMYEVSFAGGSICVNVSKYGGTKEVKKFDRQLHRMKEQYNLQLSRLKIKQKSDN